jgi:hypothetical protein
MILTDPRDVRAKPLARVVTGGFAFTRALFSLERPQEINNLLLLPSVQLIEMFDDFICLAARALVISDSV